MDEPHAGAKPDPKDLEPRPPVEADLVALCRELNQRDAHYVVVGGFAVIAAVSPRMTVDIDLVVAVDRENEAKVFAALATLPDNAVRELQPGELQQYSVIRVAAPALAHEGRHEPRQGRRGPGVPPLLVCRTGRRTATSRPSHLGPQFTCLHRWTALAVMPRGLPACHGAPETVKDPGNPKNSLLFQRTLYCVSGTDGGLITVV